MSKRTQLEVELKEINAIRTFCEDILTKRREANVAPPKKDNKYEEIEADLIQFIFSIKDDLKQLEQFKQLKQKSEASIRLYTKVESDMNRGFSRLEQLKSDFEHQKKNLNKHKKDSWNEKDLERHEKKLILIAKELNNNKQSFDVFKHGSYSSTEKEFMKLKEERANIKITDKRALNEDEKKFLSETNERNKQLNTKIDQIGTGLSDLKYKAENIKDEFDEQKEIILKLLDRTTMVGGTIDNSNRNMVKLLNSMGGFGKLCIYITLTSIIILLWAYIISVIKK